MSIQNLDELARAGVVSSRWVYFVGDYRRMVVKIGTTNNLKRRIGQLQTGNAGELVFMGAIPCLREDSEHVFHELFSSDRDRGEWFGMTGELVAFIKSNACGGGDEWATEHDDKFRAGLVAYAFSGELV